MNKPEPRDTFKYYFKLGNKRLHGGQTKDLDMREHQHRQKRGWKNGHIFKVGNRCTKRSALKWERDNGFQANSAN